MRNKTKTTDTVIRRDERSDTENLYSYELIMKESSRVASWRIPLYSIRVNMTDSSGEVTHAETGDNFADAGKAILFYEKVVRNLATPIDLAYILEDEMA